MKVHKLVVALLFTFVCLSFSYAETTKQAVVKKDNVDILFAPDKEISGYWRAVDFVDNINDFTPGAFKFKGDLYLKDIAFIEGGATSLPAFAWTNGYILNYSDSTAARYVIKDFPDGKYMFMEWKSGDYIFRGLPPKLYVLKRISDIKNDDINIPFKNDPKVIGVWESVDFVDAPENFTPGKKSYSDDLYLKKLVFEAKGKMPEPWRKWTKDYVLSSSGDGNTASAYTIVKLDDGKEYMFVEWKSGDYIFRGKKPSYYVLTKTK
jgi:bla regulator protein BlaR1